jgi:DNA-binding transcriptional LysR family regulator
MEKGLLSNQKSKHPVVKLSVNCVYAGMELRDCLSLRFGKRYKARRLIALFEDQIEIYEQHIHAVYYQQEHLPKRVRLFIEFLAQKLSKFR